MKGFSIKQFSNILTIILLSNLNCTMDPVAAETTSYTYNSYGQVLTIDGPRTDVTDVTTYTYDTSGNVATITNAVGHVTQFTSYDGAGRPLTIIDANGVTTELTYTPRGWLATSTIKGPSGQTSLDATTTYTYDSAGRVTQIDMPNGTTIDFEYDDAGRLTAIENALGERIEYTLDAAGNRTGEVIKDDLGTIQKTLTQTFDELSRLRSIVGASNQTTTFDYDVNDNQTEVVDGRNNDTDSAFDALNRLTTITDADLNDASMGYDSRDRLTSVTDQRNLVTNYVYDAYDNLTSLQSPDTGTTTFTHDDAGNVLTKTDAEGIVTNYNYDALNRLLTVSYPAYSAHNITFTYDDTTNGNFGEGRLTSVSDASGSTAYVYDYQGNITEVTTTIGSDSYTVSYAYDLAGNQTQITYPDGRTLDYTRDASGQITAVDTTQGVTTTAIASSISYKPFGPVSGLTYGNNLDLSVTFDQDYRLTGIDVDTGTVQDLDYTHDAANNIDGKTDGTGSELDTTYTYDNLNRLTDAATTAGSKVYSYDAVSNRTSFINESNQTDSYAYDSLSNRLSTITEPADTQTYAYDYNGNIISRTDTAGEGMVYIHTPDNRLAEINEKVLEGGSIATYVIATYQYNAAGQRVSKTVGGVTTHYVYHLDGSMLYETTTSATNSTHYLSMHTGGLPQGLALVVNDSSQSLTDAILFQHNDHLATPKVLTDSAGAIVWQASHTPFGEATVNTDVDNDGTYFVLNTRFPGQYYDDESGLHYNWHRYYDTKTGRYITSDPIGLEGGLNTYGYVGGSPLSYYDMNGLHSTEAHNHLLSVLGKNLKLHPHQIQAMQSGSKHVDSFLKEKRLWGYQHDDFSYIHALTSATHKDKYKACLLTAKYIKEKLELYKTWKARGVWGERPAYFALGEALHPVMDNTSPVHRGYQSFSVYNPINRAQHGPNSFLGVERKRTLEGLKELLANPSLIDETVQDMIDAINGADWDCSCYEY